jgi:hypothetical protein
VFVDRVFVDRVFVDRVFVDRVFVDRVFVDRGLVDRVFVDRGLVDWGLVDWAPRSCPRSSEPLEDLLCPLPTAISVGHGVILDDAAPEGKDPHVSRETSQQVRGGRCQPRCRRREGPGPDRPGVINPAICR